MDTTGGRAFPMLIKPPLTSDWFPPLINPVTTVITAASPNKVPLHARWMMVQAAQHLGLHRGPLGVFFRRLAKKKNRNVAVVATARKLVTIAWHMLTNNEPYRYAQAKTVQA